ncbi:MAG: alpha/beta hydrolase, partial [Nocardioides sp.]
LEDSFCRTPPEVALQFAAVTFRSDNRADLGRVTAPTLVLQVREDALAPMTAGTYVHEHIPGSRFQVLETRGHAPHVSDPEVVVSAIGEFLGVPARG